MAEQSVQVFAFAAAPGDRLRSRRVVIGGISYVVTLEFRPLIEEGSGGAWLLSMATIGGQQVIQGALLRGRVDCLYGVVAPLRPPGAVIPYNATDHGDPREGAFTTGGWLLCYFPGGYVPEDFAISSMAG